MPKKNLFIIANWKMNPPDIKQAEHLFNTVRKGIKKKKEIEVVLCPPFVYFPKFKSSFALGAQNCFWEKEGAYTGEISADMLKSMDYQYVIIGHSERRRYFNETDEMVNKKLNLALKARLRPILCVGEETRDAFDTSGRVINEMSLAVSDQLKKGLAGISSEKAQSVIIAYEPIWAIGTGQACDPNDAMKAKLFIRKNLVDLYGRPAAEKVKIIYGGSVDARNAPSYVKEADMDGLLIGGASLNASEFIKIVDLCSA